ncbi:hypothetical protein [Bernardetia sp.]|uniref:hypothetical protein n=1 Tax=Bernardetia sp. TaxID=1937974 RepID=UPI0025B858E0|nr:hypothetical protein [Bernardetia sp.]
METIYTDHQIIFISSLVPAYAVIGVGFFCVFIGLIFFRKVYKKIRFFWLIFGLALMTLGVLDLKVGKIKKLTIDKEKEALIVSERKYFGKEVITSIPFDNFSHIEVMRDWTIRQGNLFSRNELTLNISLVRWGLKPIELGIYSEKAVLKQLINKLRTTVSFPVYLVQNPEDKSYANFSRQFLNADNVELSYNYPLAEFMMPPDTLQITEISYDLPRPINISIIKQGSDDMAVWNNTYNVFWIALVGIMTFGGLYLLQNWVLPKRGFGVAFALFYASGIITGVVWIGFVLSATFSKTQIEFRESNISYSTRLFGIKAFEQITAKAEVNDILPIINSVNPQDAQLTVVSVTGLTLMVQNIAEPIDAVNVAFKKAQESPMDYRILIDVESLTMGERLLLEKEMRRYMTGEK